MDEVVANQIVEEELQIIRKENNGKPTPVLVDNEKVKAISSEARKAFAASADFDEIGKVAIVGGSIFIRTVANFIFRMSKSAEKMRFFSNQEEALQWLREGSK
jgi:hypothetical protein